MGHMKDLLITIHRGGDEAVEAAQQIAGLSEVTKCHQPAPATDSLSHIHGHGWVIETRSSWNGEPQFWRNGHGWMGTLRQATVFVKKNTAISKCVQLNSRRCSVKEVNFSTGRTVYPPSRTEEP
jgi:hypothetical protein